jgi:hypothetical protein
MVTVLPGSADMQRVTSALITVASTYNRRKMLDLIVHQAQVLVNADHVSVFLRDELDPTRIQKAASNKLPFHDKFYLITLDQHGLRDGLTGWVFATGQTLMLDSIREVNDPASRDNVLSELRNSGKQLADQLVWKDKTKSFVGDRSAMAAEMAPRLVESSQKARECSSKTEAAP